MQSPQFTSGLVSLFLGLVNAILIQKPPPPPPQRAVIRSHKVTQNPNPTSPSPPHINRSFASVCEFQWILPFSAFLFYTLQKGDSDVIYIIPVPSSLPRCPQITTMDQPLLSPWKPPSINPHFHKSKETSSSSRRGLRYCYVCSAICNPMKMIIFVQCTAYI